MTAVTYQRTPLGRLQPGDDAYELARRGRLPKRLGTIVAVEKQPRYRSVSVTYRDATGEHAFSQNWAAHLLVRKERSA